MALGTRADVTERLTQPKAVAADEEQVGRRQCTLGALGLWHPLYQLPSSGPRSPPVAWSHSVRATQVGPAGERAEEAAARAERQTKRDAAAAAKQPQRGSGWAAAKAGATHRGTVWVGAFA